MPIKFLLLGGGGVLGFFRRGGGSANFIFMGVGIFPIINICSGVSGLVARAGAVTSLLAGLVGARNREIPKALSRVISIEKIRKATLESTLGSAFSTGI